MLGSRLYFIHKQLVIDAGRADEIVFVAQSQHFFTTRSCNNHATAAAAKRKREIERSSELHLDFRVVVRMKNLNDAHERAE